MSRFPILSLAGRFRTVRRNEGTSAALRQAAGYARRRLRGYGASNFGASRGTSAREPDRYLHGMWQTLAVEEAFHFSAAPAVLRKRRQIAMIADLNLPQCRKYRVEQLAAFWRGRGVDFEYAHYQDIPRAARIMQYATHLMEYRLQTGPSADMLRYEARRLRLPIMYDLDDPLFSVSAYATYRNMEALTPAMKAHFIAEAPKYLSMMNGADMISVSTPGMVAHARLYTDRPVHLRRNFADGETLDAGARAMRSERHQDGIFRVAFSSGSQGHEIDLKEILDPLSAFITEQKNRRLLLIGHFDTSHLPKALLAQTETIKFSGYEKYLSALRTADCAVMPLCDDLFNGCKSAVRVVDAAAVGVASVVARIGDLPQMVRNGETGFVASDHASWMAALRALAEDPKGTHRMGDAARENLERRWKASDQPHIIAPELIDWVEA